MLWSEYVPSLEPVALTWSTSGYHWGYRVSHGAPGVNFALFVKQGGKDLTSSNDPCGCPLQSWLKEQNWRMWRGNPRKASPRGRRPPEQLPVLLEVGFFFFNSSSKINKIS